MKRKTTSRRQTQLDRIERKLDELFQRTIIINTQPMQWIVPLTDEEKREKEEGAK